MTHTTLFFSSAFTQVVFFGYFWFEYKPISIWSLIQNNSMKPVGETLVCTKQRRGVIVDLSILQEYYCSNFFRDNLIISTYFFSVRIRKNIDCGKGALAVLINLRTMVQMIFISIEHNSQYTIKLLYETD